MMVKLANYPDESLLESPRQGNFSANVLLHDDRRRPSPKPFLRKRFIWEGGIRRVAASARVEKDSSRLSRCSQDAERGQMVNDLLTNRKERIPLQFSEDCLYLNIYTPADLSRSSRLPVMVWIHGGGLIVGGASTYDGLALSTHENLVVVAIQYRLGIWGFLSTGDEHSRGNWGHLDQVAALHWVQDNIANFGGDPGSVTIFGESAGSESVSVLVLSPLAKNLFHRAISESGVVFTSGLFMENSTSLTEKVAAIAGCKTTTSAVIVHCLRQKSEDELLEVMQKVNFFKLDLQGDTKKHYPFTPTVLDGVLLPKAPEEILAEKSVNTVPFLVGINKQEFGWLLPNLMEFPPTDVKLDKKMVTSLLTKSAYFFNIPEDRIPAAMKKYSIDTDDPVRNRAMLQELIGDVMFGVPSVIVSRGHREGASEEETNLSKMVMKFWANFARNGNPNGKGLPYWPEYGQKEGYLQIGATTQPARRLKDKEVAFWTKLRSKKPSQKVHTEI
ncbi:carboxylesterase 1E-like isoform X2 [Peromyscus maniculatus bairdii]|uniref:carboxylesterase 1E-like isoform X2 n=1 Tax=Peromyscus maniculatus bairdii TaxID=230844 RepID=UPI003FD482BD